MMVLLVAVLTSSPSHAFVVPLTSSKGLDCTLLRLPEENRLKQIIPPTTTIARYLIPTDKPQQQRTYCVHGRLDYHLNRVARSPSSSLFAVLSQEEEEPTEEANNNNNKLRLFRGGSSSSSSVPGGFLAASVFTMPRCSPSVLISAIGHVLGGNLATPFVIDAVKTWYGQIEKPSWCPPNGIFGPVWVCLYSMIGIAAARVAKVLGGGSAWRSPVLLLWWSHYVLNLIWAPLFFGMVKLRAAAIVNALLVLSMPPIIYFFGSVDPTAAFLLLPYTAWITFATFLNIAICKLNPMDGNGYSDAKLQADIAKLQKDAAKKVGL